MRVLVTQLFFDNDDYRRFIERLRAAGIDVPVLPGIIPIASIGQIERMTALCGARIPTALRRELEARQDDPRAVAELGVAYATAQAAELLAEGAPGVHLYTLNRSPATRAIVSALRAQGALRSTASTPAAATSLARKSSAETRSSASAGARGRPASASMLSATSRSYWATSAARNSACRRSSSRMSARVCGALSQVMHSPQRSSTSTTSAALASQRSGWRKRDPQRGHMVIAATGAKLRAGPDGRMM